jgi:ABC-type Fe3+ transport system permease subunit
VRESAFRLSVAIAAGCILVLAIGLPTVALLVRTIAAGDAPLGGWTLSVRQWVLLRDTAGLAAAAVCGSIVLALPAAYLVGQFGRLSHKPLMAAIMIAPLLLPPMVYAFGWQRWMPASFARAQCVWVWAAWSWPIPALIIGSGWSRFGRAGYEAALLTASPATAFVRAVLPLLLRYVAVSGLVLFVLFVSEYSVPHACGLSVYATDLLGLAESHGSRTIEVLWPALPLVGILILGGLGAWRLWQRSDVEDDTLAAGGRPPTASKVLVAAVVGLVVLTIVAPVGRLVWHPWIITGLVEAWRTYHVELLQSVGISVAAGIVAVAAGVGLALAPVGRKTALVWTLIFGVLPGALVGEGLVATYLNVPLIYDNWPIVMLAYLARFGWVGVLVGWLATRTARRDLVAQARTDGAGEFVVDTRVCLGPNWPTLACGVCIVAALSLADVTAITLVRIPAIGTISLILIEKMHRFEEQMLVSLSLWLVVSAVPGAVLLAIALRRRDSD